MEITAAVTMATRAPALRMARCYRSAAGTIRWRHRNDDSLTRAAIQAHFEAIGKDEGRAAEIYADDAVLEYPAGGERIRGKANIVDARHAYPGGPASFEVHRVLGGGDVWVSEMTFRSERDDPHSVAAIRELRDGKVVREAIYVAEPFDPPAYRAQWSNGRARQVNVCSIGMV